MDNDFDASLLRDPSLILTHYGEEYERYEGAVVPPVYMNSLNVFSRMVSTDSIDVSSAAVGTRGRCFPPARRFVPPIEKHVKKSCS